MVTLSEVFSLFYSVFCDKNQDSTSKHVMTACFHIFSKLLIINYLNILCFVVVATRSNFM